MGTAVQSAFDYASLERDDAEFLRERSGEIQALRNTTCDCLKRIGEALIEAKQRVGHGCFQAWVRSEIQWSEDTALRYMQVAVAFKNRNLRDLTIDVSALYLLAAPSTPEPVRAEVLSRAQQGERISHAEAKQAIAAHPAMKAAAEAALDRKIQQYINKVEAPPAAPKPEPPPVTPLESLPKFLKLTEAESDWQVDLKDCLDFIDNTRYELGRAAVLAKDFTISKARIQRAIEFFSGLEAEYES